MKLSVVIVNYNVRRYIFQCLRSVEKAIRGMDADVWVVDNASTDGSLEFLKPHFPSVHFVRNEENVGFSRANNSAIQLSQSEYVLLLNPDTVLTTSALQESVKWLDAHPDAGCVGAALHNAAGAFAWESRRGVPTPLVSLCKITGLGSLFPRHRIIGRYYMRFLNREVPAQIEILSGAYMMLRRKALDEVGLLDETFFMYGEDVDLSYRLLMGGWHNYYVPYPLIHYKGESEHPSTIRYVNVFHQAMIIFYEKHFSKRYLFSGMLIRMAVYLKAFLTLLRHLFSALFAWIPKLESTTHFYCYCSPENRDEIQRLVNEMGATVTYLSAMDSPVHPPRHSYYLFDTTLFSYDRIVQTLVSRHDATPQLSMATFTPELGILLP